MAIQFRCENCQQAIRVRDEYAGRSGNCPGCRQKVRIPAPEPPSGAPGATDRQGRHRPVKRPTSHDAVRTPPQPDSSLRQESVEPGSESPAADTHRVIMKQFQGTITPVRRTMFYRLAVICVAGFVLVLPLVYIALIALLGYGVYWHAITNTHIASIGTGRSRLVAVLVYLAPILAGSVAVLFMLKPLFARTPQRFRQVSLNRGRQPLLFAFVEKICDTVHAPRPVRIDLAMDVNASASLGGGLLALARSQPVLTIGMPLVGGLTLEQFAGVLAHEFGHFSQGTAMRATYVVRSVNMWFAKVVYLRDEWDEWLAEATEEVDLRIGWVIYLTKFVVFLSRGVLWCFMMASHAMSCGLSRLMEYDADRYETRLAGTETFIATSKQLFRLNYGFREFFRALFSGKPVAASGNFVRDLLAYCNQLDHVDDKRIQRLQKKERTGWFDTHPSTADRIAASQAENAPGVFHSPLPAEVVFNGFDQLCVALQQRPE
jgi:Zn-dependent protease with chaperone function